MKRLAILCLLVLAPAPAGAADTGSLTVTVLNVSDAGGQLRVGVYDEAGFKTRSGAPVAGKVMLARPGTMTLTIDGIAPGTYAVKMFQDVNRDGFFDYGPRLAEPYGFSNDPPATTGLPSFDDAKIAIVPGANAVTVTLR